MAFVLVQHLAPDHKSILSNLVKRYTRMQVFEVEDGMAVQPNCAYVVPPNRDMAFLNGALHFWNRPRRAVIACRSTSSSARSHRTSMNALSASCSPARAATARRECGRSKAGAAWAMAQNPESTEYDGMGHSAIATGLVDYVLPPAEMPPQLMAYVARTFGKLSRAPARQYLSRAAVPKTDDAMRKVFILLSCPDRPRFFTVQAKHDQSPRRAADGRTADRDDWASTSATCSKLRPKWRPSFAIC